MAVTLKEVAALAGVSRSAVSRCFTEGASVAPATRDKIHKAADQLGVEVAVYLDAGPSRVGESSTIIDFVSTADGKVVRQGALSLEAIHEVASDVIGMESSVADQKSSEDHDPDAALPETELTQPEIEG